MKSEGVGRLAILFEDGLEPWRSMSICFLKLVGNEKRGGSGSKLLLEYSFGPWRSMSV